MKIKHNGVDKEITHTRDLPLLGLGTHHLFELPFTPRVVFTVRAVLDGYEVKRDAFKPEPNPDCEKDTHDYGTVATREGVWAIITASTL